MVVAGAEKIGQVFIRGKPATYTAVLILPLAFATISQELPPYRPEHIRPVLQYLENHWKRGDALWIYYGAGQTFQYYRKLIPIEGNIYFGECNRAKPRSYLRQLDVVRGRSRVWILLAHGSGRFRFDERKLITDYLNTIGTQLDRFYAPLEDTSTNRAEVFLYDLSDTQKLAKSSAGRYKIDNPFPPVLWACYSTMSPLGPSKQVLDALMQSENK
jgi:hypothetical protein